MTKSVGIIGVGLMGHGIARNILKKGFSLALLDHPGNQPVQDLVEAGARVCASIQEIAESSEILILCVTGAPEVEAVLLAPDGVLQNLRAGTIVVDCSTSVPATSKRMAQRLAEAGGYYLDAPMTRTAQHAHEGTLHLLIGGDQAVLEQARPVLEAFTEKLNHVGPVGNGHSLKLLHNYVSLGSIALIAEAAACAAHNGVDPQVFVDVLAAGGGAGIPLDRLKPYLLSQDASNLPFFMANAHKDLSYYVQMASDSESAQRIGLAVERTYDAAVQEGGARVYVPELVRVLRDAG